MENCYKDPLVLAYEAIRMELDTMGLSVYDDLPDAITITKLLPSVNLSCVSSAVEKAFMREFEPHIIKSRSDGLFDVITETARFEYVFNVSFFSAHRGNALSLATEFMTKIETTESIKVCAGALYKLGKNNNSDNSLIHSCFTENIQILLLKPPSPPEGEPDLYMSVLSLGVRGKLFTCDVVPAFDVNLFKIKAVSM